MIRSILVPLDGSPFAEHALPAALGIARRSGAAIQLVQVHVPLIYIEGIHVFEGTLDAKILGGEKAYLECVALGIETLVGARIACSLPVGAIGDQLIEQARACKADLVVMTTHGRGALSRFWLGSTADEIVRRGPAPVLLLRPHEGRPDLTAEPALKHMLIPLDGTSQAEEILEPALALGSLTGADYTLLRVVEPIQPLGMELGGYAPAGLELPLLKELQAGAQAYLDNVAERLRARGVRVHTRVAVDAHAAGAILNEAKTNPCDLIAIETHGRGGLTRLLLGSIADKVVRGATCSVLVHRSPALSQVSSLPEQESSHADHEDADHEECRRPMADITGSNRGRADDAQPGVTTRSGNRPGGTRAVHCQGVHGGAGY
jgi:nucleotide-binding universal stress UspA family protein